MEQNNPQVALTIKNLYNKEITIDWEQRRYEIIRDSLYGCTVYDEGNDEVNFEKTYENASRLADYVIKRLQEK